MTTDPTKKCDTWTCQKRAVFKTKRRDAIGQERKWCAVCFADKASKYELGADRL